MSETARGRAEEKKLESQVDAQLKVWFKLNHDYLIRSKKETVLDQSLYESECLQVTAEGVQGPCYVIAKLPIRASPDKSGKSEERLLFLRVKLHLNFKNQMLLVYKQDLDNTSKMTFNEIALADPIKQFATEKDYTRNQVDLKWQHVFEVAAYGKEKHVIACASESDL